MPLEKANIATIHDMRQAPLLAKAVIELVGSAEGGIHIDEDVAETFKFDWHAGGGNLLKPKITTVQCDLRLAQEMRLRVPAKTIQNLVPQSKTALLDREVAEVLHSVVGAKLIKSEQTETVLHSMWRTRLLTTIPGDITKMRELPTVPMEFAIGDERFQINTNFGLDIGMESVGGGRITLQDEFRLGLGALFVANKKMLSLVGEHGFIVSSQHPPEDRILTNIFLPQHLAQKIGIPQSTRPGLYHVAIHPHFRLAPEAVRTLTRSSNVTGVVLELPTAA